jgi:hypothetical protein
MKHSLLAVIQIIVITSCSSQTKNDQKAPEAGTYKGYTISSNLTAKNPPGQYGGGVYGMIYGVNTNLNPSIFGDLIINANGTYKLTRTGETGKWTYVAKTGEVKFTGKLSASSVKYNYWVEGLNFQIAFPYEDKTIQFSFSKKREAVYIKPEKPNGNFSGKMVLQNGEASSSELDLATGKLSKQIEGKNPSRSNSGWFSTQSSNYYSPDIYVYDASEKKSYTINSEKILGPGKISKYYSSAVSPDGKYLILFGETSAGLFEISSNIYFIINKNGDYITGFTSRYDKNTWSPSWTRDGKVLTANDDNVILYSPENKQQQTIYKGELKAASLNPDGKTLLILRNGLLKIIDIATGTEQAYQDGRFDAVLQAHTVYEIGWAPDGKSVAFSAQSGNNFIRYRIVLLPATGEAQYVSDENGSAITLGGPNFGW